MSFKRKFNIGDKVKVVKTDVFRHPYMDKIGVITNIYNSLNKKLEYLVLFNDAPEEYFYANELLLVDKYDSSTNKYESQSSTKSSPKVTTITDDQLNRMYTEFTELGDRAEKLEKFINSPGFNSVDEQSKTELMIQLDAMKIYYRVLVSRYNRLVSSKTNTVLYMD